MTKTKNPQMNLSTSMSKWNAKINPKLNGEGKNEEFTRGASKKNESLLRKPNTAQN